MKLLGFFHLLVCFALLVLRLGEIKDEEKRPTSRMIGQLSGCQQRPRNSLITETPIMILFWWRGRMGMSHTGKEFPVG